MPRKQATPPGVKKVRDLARDKWILDLARECQAKDVLWPSRIQISIMGDADEVSIYRSVCRLRKEGRVIMSTVKVGPQNRLRVESVV
jgi:hypothetical protein